MTAFIKFDISEEVKGNFEPKGLDLDLVNKKADSDSLKCIYCNQFLNNPVQNEEGDRCCWACYQYHMNLSGLKVDKANVLFDRFANKSLDKLEVYCPNKKYGCIWLGTVFDLREIHEKSCQFIKMTCKLCGEEFPMGDKVHRTCRFQNCPYCGDVILKTKLQKHFDLCVDAPPACKFCGDRVPDQLEHMNKCQEAECVYQFFGCEGHKDLSPTEIQTKHDRLIFKLVINLADEKTTLEKNLNEVNDDASSLKEKVDELKEENKQLVEKNENLLQVYGECSKGVGKIQSKMEEIDGEISKLSDEINRRVKGGPSNLIFKERLAAIDRTYSKMNQSLSDLDLRLQLLDNKYVEGKITWKIDNIEYRISQARTGEVTALHSAPCYTSQHGYKFCVRVYLDGDGVGKGSHVSLFFVLMKSEYDDILDWPFKRTIKFELLNIENPHNSVIETFQTDISSSSFKKPDREMNIAAGCPLFISNDKFKKGKYIHRNCVYVRATVIEHHDMRYGTY